jgi:hypothetical protein
MFASFECACHEQICPFLPLPLVRIVQEFIHVTHETLVLRKDFWTCLSSFAEFAELCHIIECANVLYFPVGQPRIFNENHHICAVSTFVCGFNDFNDDANLSASLSMRYDEKHFIYDHSPKFQKSWGGFRKLCRWIEHRINQEPNVPPLVQFARRTFLESLVQRCHYAIFLGLHDVCNWIWTHPLCVRKRSRCLCLRPDGTLIP